MLLRNLGGGLPDHVHKQNKAAVYICTPEAATGNLHVTWFLAAGSIPLSTTIFHAGLMFYPEDGGSRLLRNFGNGLLPDCVHNAR
jgi:hypothetical protein